MKAHAAITVLRSREELQRLWQSLDHHAEHVEGSGAAVTFKEAPGDRGTEIHVELPHAGPGGGIGDVIQKLAGAAPLAKVKDELRRFKQRVETGEVARSDAVPEGERFERKLKQRPAQPLPDDSRLEKAGV